MGIGGWSGDSPAIKDYLARHKAAAANGAEPDRWASPVTYASLQMLQQAIERVGKIDRAAVIKDLQTGTFDTVIGKVKLENNMPTRLVGRPVAGRRVLRRRAGQQRRRARRDRAEAGLGGAVTSRRADAPVRAMTNAILTGLMLGGMYALIAMGLTLQYGVARIMNLSYGEFLVAAAFASHWLFTGWAINPLVGLMLVVPLAFVAELGDLPLLLTPLVRRAPNARRARGRQHPRDLRPAVRRSGLDARDVRRGLLQLLVPRRSACSSSARRSRPTACSRSASPSCSALRSIWR